MSAATRLSGDPTLIYWRKCEKSCLVRSSYTHRRVVDSMNISIRSCRMASGAETMDSHCGNSSARTKTKPIEMMSRG